MADNNSYDNSQVNIPGYEVCYFRNICNLLIPYPVDTDLDYLPISKGHYYIPASDIVIYTTIRGENNLCPIPYTVDTINNKIIIDPKYKKYKLYYGSRNQFRYKRLPVLEGSQEVPLSNEFRSGYNENNYFVFLNGRLLNKAFYKILIPSLDNNKIRDKVLYLTNPLKITDILDVFYISNAGYNRINGLGDLVVKAFKVKATEPIQRDIDIPLPYKDYPIASTTSNHDSFMVFKHGVRLDYDKYAVLHDEETNRSYIRLLDIDDYLNYDDDITFIFPYYKSDDETDDSISKSNVLKFSTVYKTVDTDTKTVTINPIDSDHNITNTNALYIFKNTELVDQSDYSITGTNAITFNDTIKAGTQISIIVETNRDNLSTNEVIMEYFNLPVTTDGQWSFTLPESDIEKSYLFFRNGKVIPDSDYSVSNGKLILGREHNDLHAGENITAVYSKDGGDFKSSLNFYFCSSTVDSNLEAVVSNDAGLRYTTDNSIVFVNNGFIPSSYYKISGNTIKFTDTRIKEDDDVSIVLFYKAINQHRLPVQLTESSSTYTKFIVHTMTANEDNQIAFDIPYPGSNLDEPDFDVPFMLFLRGLFIPATQYVIDKSTHVLRFNSTSYVEIHNGDILEFVFCYGNVFAPIQKTEYTAKLFSSGAAGSLYYIEMPSGNNVDISDASHITDTNKTYYTMNNDSTSYIINGMPQLSDGDTPTDENTLSWYTIHNENVSKNEDNLPPNTVYSPIDYLEPINLSERLLVFYSGTYVEPERYVINRYNRTIFFKDITGANGKDVNIVSFHTGNASTGSIGYVPKSGYLLLDESKMDRNLNKKLMMVFVNGILVPKSNIYDLSNNLKKITRDIKSRYDLNIINASPLVTEFKPLYNPKYDMQYNINIVQTPNQRITVRTESGEEYNSSFTVAKDSTIYLSIEPSYGYIAGEITVNGENRDSVYGITSDLTITATTATKAALANVTVTNNYDNQTLVVTCNGKDYTSSFKGEVGSKITAKAYASREGYTPGNITISNPTITSSGVTVSITKPVVSTFKFAVLNKNLDNQDIFVYIKDENTNTVLANNVKAPMSLDNVPFGSKFEFKAIPKAGYTPTNNIGVFTTNKPYIADYMYPLDNLIPGEASKYVYKTITISPIEHEVIYFYTWSDYTEKKMYKAVYGENDVVAKVPVGFKYEIIIETDYGYSQGRLVSEIPLVGTIENNMTITTETPILNKPVVVVTRDDSTSSIYTIKVITGDNFAPLTEGVYEISEGTLLYAQVYQHNVLVYTSNDAVVQEGTNIITLLNDGTVSIALVEDTTNG